MSSTCPAGFGPTAAPTLRPADPCCPPPRAPRAIGGMPAPTDSGLIPVAGVGTPTPQPRRREEWATSEPLDRSGHPIGRCQETLGFTRGSCVRHCPRPLWAPVQRCRRGTVAAHRRRVRGASAVGQGTKDEGHWRPGRDFLAAERPDWWSIWPLICGLASGGEGTRTPGLLRAREALYQLSYTPSGPHTSSRGPDPTGVGLACAGRPVATTRPARARLLADRPPAGEVGSADDIRVGAGPHEDALIGGLAIHADPEPPPAARRSPREPPEAPALRARYRASCLRRAGRPRS